MSSTMSLDDAVQTAASSIASSGAPTPDALLFAATGSSRWVDALDSGVKLDLADVEGTPEAFRTLSLIAGTLSGDEGTATVWVLDDSPRGSAADAPAWTNAFPVWLSAAAGAQFLIHASAGVSLDPSIGVGSIVRASDHINLSGTTPLLGLGASRLGPLFPDQTRLHDAELAGIYRSAAGDADISAVAACTLGPALSTPAELGAYRSVGAGVAVQRLSDPLIAAAHAGLGALALTAVTSTHDESPDMQTMIERATRVAPALDEAVLGVARALGPAAAKRRAEPDA